VSKNPDTAPKGAIADSEERGDPLRPVDDSEFESDPMRPYYPRLNPGLAPREWDEPPWGHKET